MLATASKCVFYSSLQNQKQSGWLHYCWVLALHKLNEPQYEKNRINLFEATGFSSGLPG